MDIKGKNYLYPGMSSCIKKIILERINLEGLGEKRIVQKVPGFAGTHMYVAAL